MTLDDPFSHSIHHSLHIFLCVGPSHLSITSFHVLHLCISSDPFAGLSFFFHSEHHHHHHHIIGAKWFILLHWLVGLLSWFFVREDIENPEIDGALIGFFLTV